MRSKLKKGVVHKKSVKVNKKILLVGICILATLIIGVVVFFLYRISYSVLGASFSSPVVVNDSNSTYILPSNYYGMDVELPDEANLATITKLFVGLHPQFLRFASTNNCYSWHTGGYIAGCTPTSYFVPKFTLADFATLIRATGATPVFVLNMISSGSSWNERLTDQIAFLQTAQNTYGLPIKYVELGNEVYNTSIPSNTATFPTALDYKNQVNIWTQTLKQNFPGVLVGASFSLGSYPLDTQWDQNAEFSQSDALVIHPYTFVNNNFTDTERANIFNNQSLLDRFLSLPYLYANVTSQFMTKWSTVHKNFWLTELGYVDDQEPWVTYGTWAGALHNELYELLTISESKSNYYPGDQGTRISMALPYYGISQAHFGGIFTESNNYWGRNNNPVAQGLTYTPIGLVLQQFGLAQQGATSATLLSFSPSPQLSNAYPQLYGFHFHKQSGDQILLVNLGQSQTIQLATSLAKFNADEILSASPATLGTGNLSGSPTNISDATGIIPQSTITIPAYSVVRLFSTESTITPTPITKQQSCGTNGTSCPQQIINTGSPTVFQKNTYGSPQTATPTNTPVPTIANQSTSGGGAVQSGQGIKSSGLINMIQTLLAKL